MHVLRYRFRTPVSAWLWGSRLRDLYMHVSSAIGTGLMISFGPPTFAEYLPYVGNFDGSSAASQSGSRRS